MWIFKLILVKNAFQACIRFQNNVHQILSCSRKKALGNDYEKQYFADFYAKTFHALVKSQEQQFNS